MSFNNLYLPPLHEFSGDSKCIFFRFVPFSLSVFFNAGFNGDTCGVPKTIGVMPDLRATYDNSIVFNSTGVIFTCSNSISQNPSKSSVVISIAPDLLSNSFIRERICINLSVVKSFHTLSSYQLIILEVCEDLVSIYDHVLYKQKDSAQSQGLLVSFLLDFSSFISLIVLRMILGFLIGFVNDVSVDSSLMLTSLRGLHSLDLFVFLDILDDFKVSNHGTMINLRQNRINNSN
ncbi:hypothetical protein AGLY_014859 [Aphis glycines]|uniref:Uncharacterized protein n=1 Tax=Aphis glycines TaxID=307491 RepID=A0A6G0T2K1_APHGL|nr:hypothetical protein AGLY_014859 [Aphis glycines]